jgi:hypothetical protein
LTHTIEYRANIPPKANEPATLDHIKHAATTTHTVATRNTTEEIK